MSYNFKDNPFSLIKSPFHDNFYSTTKNKLPQLQPPVLISVEQSKDNSMLFVVTFSSTPYSTEYKIYANGNFIGSTNDTSYIHQFLQDGTYDISVKTFADGFMPSVASNVITITTIVGVFLFSGLNYIWTGIRKILVIK